MTEKVDPLLDLDSRRRIFRHIEKNPGLHLRGLQRSLEIPLGTIEYHLHQMEKGGLIVSRDDGRFKAFFAKEGIDRRDKDILYYVRQEMPRQIVLQLLLHPGMTHSELTSALPISGSTCSFHVKKLVTANIITEERIGRSKRFKVNDAERTAGVIVRYRRSFLDDLVDRFTKAWLDLGHHTAAGVTDEEPLLDEVETRLISTPGTEEPDPGLTKGSTEDEDPKGPEPTKSERKEAPTGLPPLTVVRPPTRSEARTVDDDEEEESDESATHSDDTRRRNGRRPPGSAPEAPGTVTEPVKASGDPAGDRPAAIGSTSWSLGAWFRWVWVRCSAPSRSWHPAVH